MGVSSIERWSISRSGAGTGTKKEQKRIVEDHKKMFAIYLKYIMSICVYLLLNMFNFFKVEKVV